MTQYLLEFEAHTGSGVETIRVATKTYVTGPDDTPANEVYDGVMMNAGELNRQLSDSGGTIGGPSINAGYFEIANADGSRTGWLEYGVGGRKFRLYTINDVTSAFSSRTLIFTGTLRGFASSDFRKSIQIRVRDKLESLQIPILSDEDGPEVYGGTTTSSGSANKVDGDESLRGQPKGKGYGYISKLAPPLVNQFYLVYEVRGIAGTDTNANVEDGGIGLTLDGEDADVATLIAATIAAGHYRTTSGYFRLGAAPAKAISADYFGSPDGPGGDRHVHEPGPLAKVILLDNGISSGDIDSASFEAIVSDVALLDWYRCGRYVSDLTTTVLDVVSEILASVGGAIVATADDKFRAVCLNQTPLVVEVEDAEALVLPPETALDTFTIRDILQGDGSFQIAATPQAEGDGVPAWSINLKHSKYENTRSKGDLSTGINDGLVQDLGQAYRQYALSDASIQDKHPLAQTLEFQVALVDEDTIFGVPLEAIRRLLMYGVPRKRVSISLTMERFARETTIELGDVVALDIDHFGWSPKYFYVIGINMQFGSRRVTLTLWG